MADWKGPQGYEIDAGTWGVSMANYRDDSSGATRLTVGQALTLGRMLIDAGLYALDKRMEDRP